MTVTFEQKTAEDVIEIHLSGKVGRADYDRFVPEIERIIAEKGKVRVLVVMEDFHGWDAGGLWQDIKFDWTHYKDFERIAFLGDKSWEKGMARFCKPFTTAKIRYFTPDETDEARQWVQQE